MIFTKKMHDLIESCNKIEDQTVNLVPEITEMRQQMMLMGERMKEMNQHMTELEQKRSDPLSQGLVNLLIS